MSWDGFGLARYRSALEASADPAVLAGWIAETRADRQAIVEELGDLISALRDAEPDDKQEAYRSQDEAEGVGRARCAAVYCPR